MSFVITGGLSMLAGLGCLLASETFGIAALVLSALFGSATALALPGLGGIQPTHLILGFLLIRAMADKARLHRIATVFGSGAAFWLVATWAIGMACTLLMPRLFAGQVIVSPIRAEGLVEGATEMPLAPTPGNVTQALYFTADALAFFIVASFLTSERAFKAAIDIYLAYCVGNIVFGILDLVTAKTGTTAALEFMRNAEYAIYDELDPADVQRVKGSFTEASAFAYATIGCFCFTTRLALAGWRPRLSGATAALSFGFILLSTSSTGYLAALFCVVMLYGGAVARVLTRSGSDADVGFVVLGPVLVLGALAVVAMLPGVSDVVGAELDAVVFDKATSESGIARASANATGMQAFFDSYGFGTGIGSTRCSSFIVAALSSIGVLGTATYAGLIASALGGRPTRSGAAIEGARAAVRCALAGSIVAASLSAALIDLGVVFFGLVALATTDFAATRVVPSWRERTA